MPALVDQGTAYPGATSGCPLQPEACSDWTGTVSGTVCPGPSLGVGTGAQTVGFDCSGLVLYAV